MLMEWENHTWSCSPNTLAELLEPGGSGAYRDLVRAGLWCVLGSGACWALVRAGFWCMPGSVPGAGQQSGTALSPACTFPGRPQRH